MVLGWLMVRPCLLIAIRTMSGKPGSDVCWKEINEDEWKKHSVWKKTCRREDWIKTTKKCVKSASLSHVLSLRRMHSQRWASGTPPSRRPPWPPPRPFSLVCCRRQRWAGKYTRMDTITRKYMRRHAASLHRRSSCAALNEVNNSPSRSLQAVFSQNGENNH